DDGVAHRLEVARHRARHAQRRRPHSSRIRAGNESMKKTTILLLALTTTLCAREAAAQRRSKEPPKEQREQPAEPETQPGTRRTETMEMTLAVGENKTIPAWDVKNFSEGTPGIVDVKLTSDSSQFVIVGQKAGSTSLLLIKKNGQEINWVINVFSRSPQLV